MFDIHVIATTTTGAGRERVAFDVTERLASMADKEIVDLARHGWRQNRHDDPLCRAGSAVGALAKGGDVSIRPQDGLAYVERQRPGLLSDVVNAMHP